MNLDDYLYTTSPGGANIAPADLRFLLPYVDAIAPKIIVEIGTFYGGSARLWQARYKPDVLITIDIKKRAEDLDWCHYLYGRTSQHPETVAAVTNLLDGELIDFLFIDGGHHYLEVKQDFELYSPLVRPGGLIMFHDIYNDSPGMVEVPRFWQELTLQYETLAAPNENNTSGTGIVFG